jgi:hypothetical protein
MATGTYDGTPITAMIANQTNPWVEVDGKPVIWSETGLPRVECPCGENGQVVLASVLDGMDSPEGIQRCDACDIYEGDLDAALALANLVGGTVKYEIEEAD